MKLKHAQAVASHLIALMQPHCERIAVAGSIRRECPTVGDIEIVVIPRWGKVQKPGNLFGETVTINELHHALEKTEWIRWIKPGTSEIITWPIKPEGKYWRGVIRRGVFDSPDDIKLDMFLCRPENWGVIYTIRTGSSDFSREIVTYARDKTPYRIHEGNLVQVVRPYAKAGVDEVETVPCPDEETLFATLGLQWVDPRARLKFRVLPSTN